MKQLLTLLLLALVAGHSHAGPLQPFSSDGCSAFPDGTVRQKNLWLSCCTEHDLAYWAGGSRSQRKDADLQLKRCVQQVGQPEIAQLMLAGVRVGGSPYLPTPFRWGYGWPYPRGYQPLSRAEQAAVAEQTIAPRAADGAD